MAMIKCPECGKEMSTNAKCCPNCGSIVTICPECGKIMAGSPEICDSCGYSLKQEQDYFDEPQEIKKKQPAFTSIENNSWVNNLKNNSTAKTLKLTSRILTCAHLIVLAIACIIIILWVKKDAFERLLDAKSVLNQLEIFVSLGCIIFIINQPFEFMRTKILHLKLAKILYEQNIDSVDYLIKYSTAELGVADDTAANTYELVAYATYINKDDKVKKFIFAGLTIKIILAVITGIILGICLIENAKIIISYITLEQKLSVSILDWGWIATTIILIIISFIYGIAFNVLYAKRLNIWYKENINSNGIFAINFT